MAKRFKRKAKVGVMVRYWYRDPKLGSLTDRAVLRYGIIAAVPTGVFYHNFYAVRDCQTSMVVHVTEAAMTIHKA